MTDCYPGIPSPPTSQAGGIADQLLLVGRQRPHAPALPQQLHGRLRPRCAARRLRQQRGSGSVQRCQLH